MSPVAPTPRDGSDPTPTPMTMLADQVQSATLQAVLAQSPIGAGIFDAECRYVMINEALQRIIGLPAHQLLGRRVDEVLGPIGVQVGDNLRAAMASGAPLVNQEFTGSTYAHKGAPRRFLASYFRLDDDEGHLIGAASLVNDVTEQHRTRAELGAANERLSMLSRVSAALATCLDVHDALASFAELVVPAFADHCVIDVFDEERTTIRRLALTHAEGLAPDDGAWALPGSVVSYPDEHPAIHAMRTGRAVLVHAADEPDFLHIAPTPRSAAYGRKVGVRSAMTAPLLARGDVLGAVSFVTSASGRAFAEADVELGEELASRVAIALDNARLYAREQHIALTLQRSLLPESLPHTPALETAAVYHPAAHDGSVGGDWYDVVPLSCGRVGLVMGDVMGRGVHAAALMGQLRAAVRAYVAQDLPPGEVLGHLDALVRGLGDDSIVTCVYAVYDAAEGTLCVANAGHLPPLLVGDNDARRIEVDGVVLGAGLGSYGQTEVVVPSGAVVAFYTDGLVERRAVDLDAQITKLGEVVRGADGSLSDVCTAVVEALDDRARDRDDLALMLVRPRAAHRPKVVRYDVVPHAAMVRDVREFASRTLAEWGLPATVAEQVKLIVSELVTNVIRHASGHEATVRLESHSDRVVVAVVDPDPVPPRVSQATADDEGGRGLHLVEGVADRWGSRSLAAGGKVVWCELMTPAED